MGCSTSKAEDVNRERVRRRQRDNLRIKEGPHVTASAYSHPRTGVHEAHGSGATTSTGNGEVPRTTAKEIAGGQSAATTGSRDGNEEVVYGSSYTNRKNKEYDLLHDIVKQTKSSFIDVGGRGAGMGMLEEEDAVERSQVYARKIEDLNVTSAAAAAAVSAHSAQQSQQQPSLLSSSLGHSALPHTIFDLPLPAFNAPITAAHDAAPYSPSSSFPSSLPPVLVLLVSTLAAPMSSATTSDCVWVAHAAATVGSSLSTVKLKDSGKIVLTFEELSTDRR